MCAKIFPAVPTDDLFNALNKLLTVVLMDFSRKSIPLPTPILSGANQLYGKYPGNHATEIRQRFFPDVVLDTSYSIQYTIGL